MKNYLLKWILASLLVSSVSIPMAQAADAKVIAIHNPVRSNGIRIGDVMARKVVIETSQPYQLSKTALPAKGTNRNGIELADINVKSTTQGDKTIHQIDLRYQVFMSAPAPVVMQLPEEDFALNGGPKALSVKLPAWRFWFSPLVVANIDTAKENLQPQYKPSLVDTRTHQAFLALFAALLSIGIAGLIYINADRRWLPFMNGAFAQAYRNIKKLPRNAGQEKIALFYLHQAFNKVFGGNLFAGDIGTFVEAHPEFAKLKKDIESFFDQSNKSLFANNAGDSAQLIGDLIVFSKAMRDCERGVA